MDVSKVVSSMFKVVVVGISFLVAFDFPALFLYARVKSREVFVFCEKGREAGCLCSVDTFPKQATPIQKRERGVARRIHYCGYLMRDLK